jgi:hypothetical protein
VTLIPRMVLRAYRLPFYIYRRPIAFFWIDVTMQPFDCQNDQTEIVDTPLMLTLETY